ncbi:MAG TPA: glucose-6-phosphate dehydrogenase [Candidatus Polarisedimenticolia bacterium]|nr:glucose-6-phosphate dehydrogenase [Candidatus Polarisedimenticolia bacterium]
MQRNPFREGMPRERSVEPCVMTIFGATGDLTRRKLVPALYNLARERMLPPGFAVVGFARRELSHEAFREEMRRAVDTFSRSRPVAPEIWSDFAKGIHYCQGDFGDRQAYGRLGVLLQQISRERNTRGNNIFYLATPPGHYESIIAALGASGLSGSPLPPWTRVIIEKPFGHDLDSARELNRRAQECLREEQIYRIDHYLGKETVQNIIVMRFANGIFEPLWNQKYIDHVQITVAEDLGMEGRGAYYDASGALRDMVQNHMMQLLCLTAMEPPVAFQADPVRNEKVKVLESIRPLEGDDVGREVVRGQYGRGHVGGRGAAGFREEQGVSPGSTTETYVAIRLFIDNWRWAGVPFLLRTGKRLPKRATEIAIQFRPVPHLLFRKEAPAIEPNVLAMRIQPDEGISLKMTSKGPGAMTLQPVVMDFRYGTSFGADPPEAYERLLLDCMAGDSTLFTRRDEVELAWRFITGILDAWSAEDAPALHIYPAGSWGPEAADRLVEKWRRV